MIIGFLGKGGSGKTTLATLWTKYLLEKNISDPKAVQTVYALDNDYNMDYKYNLMKIYNLDESGNSLGDRDIFYIGQSLQEIFTEIAISATSQIADFGDEEYLFNIFPKDKITQKYSIDLLQNKNNKDIQDIPSLMLAASGPNTDDIMYGASCSHSLTTPLKVYLPLLKTQKGQFVIVDEKAGTDGVGTGVTTGFHLAVVVAEATEHGVKAAKQIIHMLRFYSTPFVIVINKIRDNTDVESLTQSFVDEFSPFYEDINDLKTKIFYFSLDEKNIDFELSENNKKEFDKIFEFSNTLEDYRIKRTKERIEKTKEYINTKD